MKVEKYFRIEDETKYPPALLKRMRGVGIGSLEWEDEIDPYGGYEHSEAVCVKVRGTPTIENHSPPKTQTGKILLVGTDSSDDEDDTPRGPLFGTLNFDLIEQPACCGALVVSDMNYTHLTTPQAILTFEIVLREFASQGMEGAYGDIILATTIPSQKQFETLVSGVKFSKVGRSKNPRTSHPVTVWMKDLLPDKYVVR